MPFTFAAFRPHLYVFGVLARIIRHVLKSHALRASVELGK